MGTTRDRRGMIDRQKPMMEDGEYGTIRDKQEIKRAWRGGG